MSALPGRNLLDHPKPRPAVDVRNYKLIGKNCHVAVGMIAAIAAVAKSQGAADGETTFGSAPDNWPIVTSDHPYPKYLYDSNGTGTDGFIRSGFTTVGSHNYGDRTEQRISIDVPSVRDVFQERGRWSENCNGYDDATVARREAGNSSAYAGTTIELKARFSFDTDDARWRGPVLHGADRGRRQLFHVCLKVAPELGPGHGKVGGGRVELRGIRLHLRRLCVPWVDRRNRRRRWIERSVRARIVLRYYRR